MSLRSSSSSSSPLREPLLEGVGGDRPPAAAAAAGAGAGGIGGRNTLRVLRKAPMAYATTLPLSSLHGAVEVGEAVGLLASGPEQLLSVRRAEGWAAAGGVQVGDRVTHVGGKRVRSEGEWAAALEAAAAASQQQEQEQQRCIPGTEDGAGAMVELRLLRLHHAHVEDAMVALPTPPAWSTTPSLVLAAPASPPAADSVLGLLLAGGGCLLGAARTVAAATGSARRGRARSWESASSDYSEIEFGDGEEDDGEDSPRGADSLEEAMLAAASAPLPPLPPYARWAHEPGAAAALDAAVPRLPLAAFPFLWYEVASPDEARAGLGPLARRFGVGVDVLRRDNRRVCPVGEPARLRPGLLLRLRNAEYDPKAAAAVAVGVGAAACYLPPSVEEEEAAVCLACGDQQQQLQPPPGPHCPSKGRRRRLRGFHCVGEGEGEGNGMAYLTRAYGMAETEIRHRNRHYFPRGVPSNEVLKPGMLLKVECVLGDGEAPPAGFHVYQEEELPVEAHPPPLVTTLASVVASCRCGGQAAGGWSGGDGGGRRRRLSAGTASLTSSSGSSSSGGGSGSIYGSGSGGRGRLFPLVDAVGAVVDGVGGHGGRHDGFV